MEDSYKVDHMQGKRYPKEFTKEILEEYAARTSTVHGISIPVNIEIKADQKVIDFSSMENILKKASTYVLRDCPCRTQIGNCDTPKDVCIHLDDYGDKTIKAGQHNAKYVTYEEALDSVTRAQEAGLVHMAYTKKDDSYPKAICGCCSCCCGNFAGILRFGIEFPFLLVTSDKIAEYSASDCIGCGVCVDRCHFEAWEMVDGKIVYDADRCYGCSNCTTTCPSLAIKMIERN